MQGVNFFLVGMPGSGKTTVGKMLAQGMGYRWIDVDQHIEAVRIRTHIRARGGNRRSLVAVGTATWAYRALVWWHGAGMLCGLFVGWTDVWTVGASSSGHPIRVLNAYPHVLCEQKLDKTATEVFAEEGEPAWREQETETLRGVRRHTLMPQLHGPALHAC